MESNPENRAETEPTPSAWEAARQAGLDMDLIEDSLRLSPSERIRVHSIALLTALELRRAMEERERAATPAPEPVSLYCGPVP